MTINCKGNLIDLTVPKVMGILNLTPDSFYDGGKFKDEKSILNRVEKMLNEGATFIDVGAYSSRPGADHVSEEEELGRISKVLDVILKRFSESYVSIDTFRSRVAETCIEMGAALINDISGASMDTEMINCIAKHQVPYIIMHMRGNPRIMQSLTAYSNVTQEVLFELSEKIELAKSKKINEIIVDPGFGFAKTLEQNYELLNHLGLFRSFGLPILVGISRKSMIYKLLNLRPNEALNGTTALNTIALSKSANILRVHDVKEAMECVQLVTQLKKNS